MNDYEKDLAIDPHKLDEEWLHQPALYMRYSELAAQAAAEADKAKSNIEVERALLDNQIRTSPELFGLAKVTETAVANTILLQEKYQRAVAKAEDARLNATLLKSAVIAFDHRKKALEMLGQLWLGSYFSVPNEKRMLTGGKRIIDNAIGKSSDKQREALNASREKAQENSPPASLRRR